MKVIWFSLLALLLFSAMPVSADFSVNAGHATEPVTKSVTEASQVATTVPQYRAHPSYAIVSYTRQRIPEQAFRARMGTLVYTPPVVNPNMSDPGSDRIGNTP